MNPPELARSAVALLARPGSTLDRVAARPSPADAALLVGLTGALWSGVCLLLWRAGHAPSRALVPIVAYLGFGFASLARLVRVTGLVLVVAEWALMSRAVVAAHQLAWSRAVPIALLALLVQAVLVGPVLR